MNIETFKDFYIEKPNFSDFRSNYHDYVNAFISEFEDNTEYLFLLKQIEAFA